MVAANVAPNTLVSTLERVSTNLEKGNPTSTHEHFELLKRRRSAQFISVASCGWRLHWNTERSEMETIDVGLSQSKANETKSKLGMDADDWREEERKEKKTKPSQARDRDRDREPPSLYILYKKTHSDSFWALSLSLSLSLSKGLRVIFHQVKLRSFSSLPQLLTRDRNVRVLSATPDPGFKLHIRVSIHVCLCVCCSCDLLIGGTMGTFDQVLGSMRLGLVGTFGFMLGGFILFLGFLFLN